MATICFRPPPLPPSKKSTHLASGNNRQRVATKQNTNNHGLLSSTYLSFRDPAEDEILNGGGGGDREIEMTSSKCRSKSSGGKRCKKLTHTNSLCRTSRDSKVIITRSQSDGNIDTKGLSTISLNRYMKVLSGSWRNLLNCKCWHSFCRCFNSTLFFLPAAWSGAREFLTVHSFLTNRNSFRVTHQSNRLILRKTSNENR